MNDIYFQYTIGLIKLDNQSGTVCSLECYYKVNKNDSPQRIGSSGNFSLGKSKTLDLNSLGIPNGTWVTAYANVVAGKDDAGKVWLNYENNNQKTAEFVITGAINFTKITLDQIIIPKTTASSEVPAKYSAERIDLIKLDNQSSTILNDTEYASLSDDEKETVVKIVNGG